MNRPNIILHAFMPGQQQANTQKEKTTTHKEVTIVDEKEVSEVATSNQIYPSYSENVSYGMLMISLLSLTCSYTRLHLANCRFPPASVITLMCNVRILPHTHICLATCYLLKFIHQPQLPMCSYATLHAWVFLAV